MMAGFFRKQFDLSVRQNRVGNTLATVCPLNHQQRTEGAFRKVNPLPCRANYFGRKMHFDQNDKLVMYEVTDVVAIDGQSRFIIGVYTISVKKNPVIYKEFFRYVS